MPLLRAPGPTSMSRSILLPRQNLPSGAVAGIIIGIIVFVFCFTLCVFPVIIRYHRHLAKKSTLNVEAGLTSRRSIVGWRRQSSSKPHIDDSSERVTSGSKEIPRHSQDVVDYPVPLQAVPRIGPKLDILRLARHSLVSGAPLNLAAVPAPGPCGVDVQPVPIADASVQPLDPATATYITSHGQNALYYDPLISLGTLGVDPEAQTQSVTENWLHSSGIAVRTVLETMRSRGSGASSATISSSTSSHRGQAPPLPKSYGFGMPIAGSGSPFPPAEFSRTPSDPRRYHRLMHQRPRTSVSAIAIALSSAAATPAMPSVPAVAMANASGEADGRIEPLTPPASPHYLPAQASVGTVNPMEIMPPSSDSEYIWQTAAQLNEYPDILPSSSGMGSSSLNSNTSAPIVPHDWPPGPHLNVDSGSEFLNQFSLGPVSPIDDPATEPQPLLREMEPMTTLPQDLSPDLSLLETPHQGNPRLDTLPYTARPQESWLQGNPLQDVSWKDHVSQDMLSQDRLLQDIQDVLLQDTLPLYNNRNDILPQDAPIQDALHQDALLRDALLHGSLLHAGQPQDFSSQDFSPQDFVHQHAQLRDDPPLDTSLHGDPIYSEQYQFPLANLPCEPRIPIPEERESPVHIKSEFSPVPDLIDVALLMKLEQRLSQYGDITFPSDMTNPRHVPSSAPSAHTTPATSGYSPESRNGSVMETRHSQSPVTGLHTSPGVHTCSECGRDFDQLHKLNHHLRYHDRPHGCKDCKLRFGTKTHLERHVNDRHDQKRRYHCTEVACAWSRRGGKSFLRKDNWRRHMENIHTISPQSDPEPVIIDDVRMTG